MPWDSVIDIKDGVMVVTITEKVTKESHTIRTRQGAPILSVKEKLRDMVLIDRENKQKASKKKVDGAFDDFDNFLKEKSG